MASFSKYYLPMCAANNNATFVSRDKDGKYVDAITIKKKWFGICLLPIPLPRGCRSPLSWKARSFTASPSLFPSRTSWCLAAGTNTAIFSEAAAPFTGEWAGCFTSSPAMKSAVLFTTHIVSESLQTLLGGQSRIWIRKSSIHAPIQERDFITNNQKAFEFPKAFLMLPGRLTTGESFCIIL